MEISILIFAGLVAFTLIQSKLEIARRIKNTRNHRSTITKNNQSII